MWAGRTLRERAAWGQSAQRRIAERTIEIQQELQSLAHHRDLLEGRLSEFGQQDGPVTMSSASLTSVDVGRFHTLMTSKVFRARHRILALRQEAMETPRPITEARLRELYDFPVWARPDAEMPAWAGAVARNRDAFADTALVVRDNAGGADQAWLLLYMVQRPAVYIATCKMTPIETFERAPVEGDIIGDYTSGPLSSAIQCQLRRVHHCSRHAASHN